MKNGTVLHWISGLLVLLAIPLVVVAGTVSVPNTFVNGEVADADEVNANFSTVTDAVNVHEGLTDPHHSRYTDLEAVLAVEPQLVGIGETYAVRIPTNQGTIIDSVQCSLLDFDGLTPDCTISQTFNRTPGSHDEDWTHSAQFNQEFTYVNGTATNYHLWVERNINVFSAASNVFVTGLVGVTPDEGHGVSTLNHHLTTVDGSNLVTGNGWIETWNSGSPAKVHWSFSDSTNPPSVGDAAQGDSIWAITGATAWNTTKILNIYDGAICLGTPIAHADMMSYATGSMRLRYRPGSDLTNVNAGDCIEQSASIGQLTGSPTEAFSGAVSALAVPSGCATNTSEVGACNFRHQSLTIDAATGQLHFFLRSRSPQVLFNVRAPHPATGHEYIQIYGSEQHGVGGPRLIVGGNDTEATTLLNGDLSITDPSSCPAGKCGSRGRIILDVENGDDVNYNQRLPNITGTHVVTRGLSHAGPTFWGDATNLLADTGVEVCDIHKLSCDGAAEIGGTDLTCNQSATGTTNGRFLVFCR